jgi:peptide/nickel transport system substrate-binding protein
MAQQHTGTTLRFIPHADLSILDPYWTPAYITRNYGYMVYDTLFAMNSQFQPQPQMVDTWTLSDDKLTYNFTLREGLKFHDGQPVRATDVVASLKRWESAISPMVSHCSRLRLRSSPSEIDNSASS